MKKFKKSVNRLVTPLLLQEGFRVEIEDTDYIKYRDDSKDLYIIVDNPPRQDIVRFSFVVMSKGHNFTFKSLNKNWDSGRHASNQEELDNILIEYTKRTTDTVLPYMNAISGPPVKFSADELKDFSQNYETMSEKFRVKLALNSKHCTENIDSIEKFLLEMKGKSIAENRAIFNIHRETLLDAAAFIGESIRELCNEFNFEARWIRRREYIYFNPAHENGDDFFLYVPKSHLVMLFPTFYILAFWELYPYEWFYSLQNQCADFLKILVADGLNIK